MLQDSRLFRIVYYLLDKGKCTAPELADKFEVSTRTIYRDLDVISAAGIPIYATQGKGGGISILPEYVMDNALLSDEEKEKIVMALQGIAVTDETTDDLLSKLGGIPTVVWLCPILPFINDTEENINGILNYCSEAEVYGIICFGMGLTLREGSREYFFRQLDHLFPGMKEKYLQTYGMQYQIVSNKNDELMQLFHHTCEKNGIVHDNRKIFEYLSTFETKCDNVQLSLFDKDFAGKSPNGI